MILYPAIDIYDGQCVRLSRGDFSQSKVYFKDPLEAAKKWADLGAEWLHVVDLNGAAKGEPVNIKAIERIMTEIDLPVQIGGGIRTQDVAEIFLTMGAGRVILGSAAIEDPDLVQILTLKYEDRVAISLDARDGKIALHGWTDVSTREVLTVAKEMQGLGVGTVIYTDISRDGMLTGPNFEAVEKMMRSVRLSVIVSGGVSSLDDIRRAKSLEAGGVILGRSLYEGTIDLKEALALC